MSTCDWESESQRSSFLGDLGGDFIGESFVTDDWAFIGACCFDEDGCFKRNCGLGTDCFFEKDDFEENEVESS